MSEQPRFKAGDLVHVWRGSEYSPDRIEGHREWTHSSGNSFIAYKLANGGECSANSIQEFADPDWFISPDSL